jgi:ribonucleoside-triphosphate reductase
MQLSTPVDKDFSMLTWNCLQMDLQRLLEGGFKIGDSYIREPQSIRSYASLACIALDF